jgi:hypothetical protein
MIKFHFILTQLVLLNTFLSNMGSPISSPTCLSCYPVQFPNCIDEALHSSSACYILPTSLKVNCSSSPTPPFTHPLRNTMQASIPCLLILVTLAVASPSSYGSDDGTIAEKAGLHTYTDRWGIPHHQCRGAQVTTVSKPTCQARNCNSPSVAGLFHECQTCNKRTPITPGEYSCEHGHLGR